jgi:hypothetical protein
VESRRSRDGCDVELDTIIELLDKHGQHAFTIVVIVQMYLFGRELKRLHKELKHHREDEELTRKELIQVGTAIAVLLDRDKRDVAAVKDVVEGVVRDAVEEISGVHAKVDPSQLGDDATTPVEAPAARASRAKSHPGAYSIARPSVLEERQHEALARQRAALDRQQAALDRQHDATDRQESAERPLGGSENGAITQVEKKGSA